MLPPFSAFVLSRGLFASCRRFWAATRLMLPEYLQPGPRNLQTPVLAEGWQVACRFGYAHAVLQGLNFVGSRQNICTHTQQCLSATWPC